jgi:hypothetical protein
MNEIEKVFSRLDPEEAADQAAIALKQLLPLLGEEGRTRFIMNLLGETGQDKISSMVHLWLAECMGEGVDPTQMCQTLVDKVAQSKQLMAITDPDLLVLFEDWFEELEDEVISLNDRFGPLDAAELARRIGLSLRGATFLLSKLERGGRL